MTIAWYRRLSAKQLKVTVLAALLLGLISSLFQLVLDLRAELAQRDTTVAEVMDMLNEPAVQAAYALDEQLAARVVSGLLLYRPILRAEIYDNYGRRMAAQDRLRDEDEVAWAGRLLGAEDVTKVQPLYAARGGDLVGEMRVTIDGQLLVQSIVNRTMVVLVTGFVRNFALALVLAVLFYYTLTRPLLALVAQLGGVDPRQPGRRVIMPPPGHADDEFGQLTARINDILAASSGHQEARDTERALLRAVIDTLPARVTLKDRDMKFVLVNREFENDFGMAGAAVIGRRIEECDFPTLAGADREKYLGQVQARDRHVLDTGKAEINIESSYTDSIGMLHTFIESKTPMLDADGKVVGIISIGTDITERKRAEAALDEANAQLRRQAEALEALADKLAHEREHAIAANRAKSEFLANMSHELRTPLNAVIGFAEVIVLRMWGPSSPKYFDYAQDIVVSARHLLNVINDILDMSKIEAGRYELSFEPTDFRSLTEDCVVIVKGRAREGRVSLHNSLTDSNLPAARIDARAVKQVMLNLLSNAIKFTPAGGEVRISGGIDGNGTLRIDVADTGIGIPEDNLERIFEPFWQGDPSVRRQSEGTGLGLAISRKFMDLHGGTLEIRSKEGQGTVATMRFPAHLVGVTVA